jgi:hypothetical protein
MLCLCNHLKRPEWLNDLAAYVISPPISLPEPPSLDRRNGCLEEWAIAVDVWIHNPPNFRPGALVIAGCHWSMVHQLQHLHNKHVEDTGKRCSKKCSGC